MEQQTAAFPVTVPKALYVKASVYHARRAGALRNTAVLLVACGLLLLAGIYVFRWYTGSFLSVLPALFLLSAGLLMPLILWLEVGSVKRKAEKEYGTFSALMQPMELTLKPDSAEVSAASLKLHDPYALMVSCTETSDFFLLIKDRDRFLLIPKAAAPENQKADVTDFLRMTFARRYIRSRHWLFG